MSPENQNKNSVGQTVSQEEIDNLMSGGGGDEESKSVDTPPSSPAKVEEKNVVETLQSTTGDNSEQPSVAVQKKELAPLGDTEPKGPPIDLDFILDIPLRVSVEIGRTKMLINDLLQLGQGSVIELDKLVGEAFEVLVNDKLVARGEVVVVNERFGVRLTDIISPMERIQQLT